LVRELPSTDSAYVSLLKPPASQRLRSGYVCLIPGKSGEEHSTEGYEEMILILDGVAELHYADKTLTVGAKQIAYVPPQTKHFLKNTGSTSLRYVYIVTRVQP
jgi:mannose-6-phosphate isomerase-like protein (cupin superfamily)